ncbi:hypothetical protein L208DRAFT_1315494 [Tricholoma matsutake]|nr:hypothetical protein L208DRAFT_1315494 [Tricholoma matsutake 945]
MTDYASQGKTCPYNVVDLSQCHSHQSYYTALSCSATAAGTLILNTIHCRKITGGASGALHQEFQELELLDNITTLRFAKQVAPESTMGDRRNMIYSKNTSPRVIYPQQCIQLFDGVNWIHLWNQKIVLTGG